MTTEKLLENLFCTHEQAMKSLDVIMEAAPWEDKDFYAQWCGQFFYFVAHATRLLAASAARLHMDRDALHIRFLDHCQEEKHHEKLLLQDLEALHWDIQDLPEHPLTAQLYQSQYYLIERQDPIALFGSIFYLEGMSLTSGPEMYKRVRKAHGEAACNFVRVHVSEDITHIDKAKQALSTLTAKEIEVVERSLMQTAAIYEGMLLNLMRTVQRTRAHSKNLIGSEACIEQF